MAMSPAGSESVPKLGSPEKEASFGQEAAVAGGDVAFKAKEEAEAAVGHGPKAGEEQPPKVPSSVSDEDFEEEFDEEMDQLILLEKLLRGKKMKRAGEIKKVRVEGDAIKRMLEVRPRNKPMPEFPPLPEDFHLLPADIRRACLSGREKVREVHQYQQYIIYQYHKKGFAEIHAYVFDK